MTNPPGQSYVCLRAPGCSPVPSSPGIAAWFQLHQGIGVCQVEMWRGMAKSHSVHVYLRTSRMIFPEQCKWLLRGEFWELERYDFRS